MIIRIISLLTILLVSNINGFSQHSDPKFGATDGSVNALETDDNFLYLGGDFSRAYNPNHFTGPCGVVDAAGNVDHGWPEVNGTISTAVSDGNGGWFIGGDFNRVGGIDRNHIAHIKNDKTVNPDFNPDVKKTLVIAASAVTKIIRDGNDLYVGGNFDNISGLTRGNIAKINAIDGSPDSDWSPDFHGKVTTMVVYEDHLFVGGSFDAAKYVPGGSPENAIPLTNFAKVAIVGDGTPDTGWDPTPQSSVVPNIITVDASGNLFIGLDDESLTVNDNFGNSVKGLIKASTSTPFVVDNSWTPEPNMPVTSLAVVDDKLLVGGFFTTISGSNNPKLARLNIDNGTLDAGFNSLSTSTNTVRSILPIGSDLLIGGDLSGVGGENIRYAAKIDAAGNPDLAWRPSPNNNVNTLASSASGEIFIGGNFNFMGGEERNYLTRIIKFSGAIDSWNPNPGNTIFDMARDGSTLYVVGEFENIGDTEITNLAGLNATDGSLTSLNMPIGGSIQTIEIDNSGNLYIAGSFTNIGIHERAGLAKILPLGNGSIVSWDPNPNGPINTIELVGSDVYVGGDFTTIGGQSKTDVAKIDLNGNAYTAWTANSNGHVNALEYDGTSIYVGGDFTTINGAGRNRLAKLSTATGAVDNSWNYSINSNVDVEFPFVNVLHYDGTYLYAGGKFRRGFGTQEGEVSTHFGAIRIDLVNDVVHYRWNMRADSQTIFKDITNDGENIFLGGVVTDAAQVKRQGFLGIYSNAEILITEVSTSNEIPSNDTYEFGAIENGQESGNIQFRLRSAGSENLNLTGSPDIITVSGPHSDDFVITESLPPTFKIGNPSFSHFHIKFVPTAVGSRTATLSIPTNDSDENPYIINLQGESKLSQTITFEPIADKLCLDDPFTLVATASSGLPVTFSIVSGPADVSGNQLTINGAGSVTVRASQAGDATYLVASDSDQTFTINMATQTISFEPILEKQLSESSFELSASASSGLTVGYSSSDPSIASISGTTVTLHAEGTTNITATQVGDGCYSAASDVVRTLTVVKQSQTITFEPISNKSCLDDPFTLEANASSGLSISFSVVSGPISLSGNQLTIDGSGEATIRASQAGDTNYQPASDVDQTFTITSESQTISFDPLQEKLLAVGSFDLSATASSGLPASYISSDPSVASISGTTVTLLQLGTTDITASQAGDACYDAATNVIQTLSVIDKNNQTITFDPIPDKTCADESFTLEATASSGLPVMFSIVSSTAVVSLSGNILTITPSFGVVTIRASQSGDDMYHSAPPVEQTFNITKADQSITFGPLFEIALSDGSFELTATSSSGNPVTYYSSDLSVASISGTTVTLHQTGSTNITASEPGNACFNPAADVTQTLIVSDKQSQAIMFSISDKTFGDVPFELSASSSSGLTVFTFNSLDESIATINGNLLSIVSAGTVEITASQEGNDDFVPSTASTTLTVLKADQTINFQPIPVKSANDPSFDLVATSSSDLPISFFSSNSSVASVNGITVTIIGIGESTITASQDGNGNFNAATSVEQTLVVSDKTSQVITFDPIADATFGDNPINLSAVASSGLPVHFNVVSGPGTIGASESDLTITGAGSITVRASQVGDNTFNPAPDVDHTFTVHKADQAISFEDLPTGKMEGDANFDLSVSSSAELTVNVTSSNPAVATVSGLTVAIVGPGTTDFTASQSGDDNHNPAESVTKSFTVDPVTSVDNVVANNTFKIFPNPFGTSFTISSDTQCQYQLRDVSGKTLRSGDLDSTVVLDTSDLLPGVYLMHVFGENYEIVEKLIKE